MEVYRESNRERRRRVNIVEGEPQISFNMWEKTASIILRTSTHNYHFNLTAEETARVLVMLVNNNAAAAAELAKSHLTRKIPPAKSKLRPSPAASSSKQLKSKLRSSAAGRGPRRKKR